MLKSFFIDFKRREGYSYDSKSDNFMIEDKSRRYTHNELYEFLFRRKNLKVKRMLKIFLKKGEFQNGESFNREKLMAGEE